MKLGELDNSINERLNQERTSLEQATNSELQLLLSTLTAEKDRLTQTVEQLESKTWDISLHEDSSGRFIILPKKTNALTGWVFDKKQAIKLE